MKLVKSTLSFLREWHGFAAYSAVGVILGLHYIVGVDMDACFTLSYKTHSPTLGHATYDKGIDDVRFVAFWTIALTALRSAVQTLVLVPLAMLMGCPTSKRDKFLESGWQFLYYTTSFSYGVYVMFFSEGAFLTPGNWWNDMLRVWKEYPHPLYPSFKLYYLVALSFWVHMVFVTLIEKWRKDFLVMMAHHFVTIMLIVGSYTQGFVVPGSVIIINLDIADIFLPLAKMFNYSKKQSLADATFALFALVWIPTRHIVYLNPMIALWYYACDDIKVDYNPAEGIYFHKYWTPRAYMVLLVALQILLLVWLKALIIAVHKALFVGHIDDQRSDSESDDEDSERLVEKKNRRLQAKKHE